MKRGRDEAARAAVPVIQSLLGDLSLLPETWQHEMFGYLSDVDRTAMQRVDRTAAELFSGLRPQTDADHAIAEPMYELLCDRAFRDPQTGAPTTVHAFATYAHGLLTAVKNAQPWDEQMKKDRRDAEDSMREEFRRRTGKSENIETMLLQMGQPPYVDDRIPDPPNAVSYYFPFQIPGVADEVYVMFFSPGDYDRHTRALKTVFWRFMFGVGSMLH